MAKREQIVAEELKNQQPVQEAEKEMRSISQAHAAYEQLMNEIRNYWRQSDSDQDVQTFRLEKRFSSC